MYKTIVIIGAILLSSTGAKAYEGYSTLYENDSINSFERRMDNMDLYRTKLQLESQSWQRVYDGSDPYQRPGGLYQLQDNVRTIDNALWNRGFYNH